MKLKSFLNPGTSRKTLIIIIVIAAIILTIFILFDPILNGIIRPKILNAVNSGPNVKVKISRMSYDLFSNSIIASGTELSIKDSSSESRDKYKISLPSLTISNINWLRVISGNGFSAGKLLIYHPRIIINSHTNSVKKDEKSGQKETRNTPIFSTSFIMELPHRINPLNIGLIDIISGKLYRESKVRGETTKDTIDNFSLAISGFALDSTAAGLKYIVADGFKFDAENIKVRYVEDGNEMKIDSVFVSGPDSVMYIKNFSYSPYLSRNEYFAKKIYRTDSRTFKFSSMELKKINYSKIINEKICAIKDISVNDFHIEILTDKRLPLNPSCCPEMPNEIMRNMDFGVIIKNIHLNRGKLFVKSLQENSDTAAVIPFSNVEAEISDLNNTDKSNPYCRIKAAGNIFNAGKLTLNLKINLLSKGLNFSYNGKLAPMSVMPMNQWLKIENLVQLDGGEIEGIDFSVDVNDGLALAYLTPVYHDLKAKVLSENKKKKVIASFFLNTFKLNDANPKDGKTKTGSIYYKRNSPDAFLDVLWIPVENALGTVAGF